MTHDELLAKIDETTDNSPIAEPEHSTYLALNALRAVVELHKPEYMGCSDNSCCGPDMCTCGETLPCPTIQAIEKELK